MSQNYALFWFRRDLRLYDNAGLYHALKSGLPVVPVFIFDTDILDRLSQKKDPRVEFIHNRILKLKTELNELGSDLRVYHGNPKSCWEKILNEFKVNTVYTNEDYEPLAKRRDNEIDFLLNNSKVLFKQYKDHVIFRYDEVLKDDNTPYTVFTPYSKKWKFKMKEFYLKPYPNHLYFNAFAKIEKSAAPNLPALGFEPANLTFPSESIESGIIKKYHLNRDIPSLQGTSRLSLHFRFGTISIREKAAKGMLLNEKWLNELIWRDFYIQIMAHFPHAMESAFKPDYNRISWDNNEEHFQKWCEGKTGYPLVDAGMRELNATGFMHNRVRMVVASFLCKHLLIDWRWGEAYFAEKLLDFELASNNGGWQWAAGSGVDAAPYFRIFNPSLQKERFDPASIYIKKWVPEYGTTNYAAPIVNHEFARKRCLETYQKALKQIEI